MNVSTYALYRIICLSVDYYTVKRIRIVISCSLDNGKFYEGSGNWGSTVYLFTKIHIDFIGTYRTLHIQWKKQTSRKKNYLNILDV